MKRIKKPTPAELALWKRVTDTTIPLDPSIQDFEKVLNQVEQQISKTEEHSNWPGRNVRLKGSSFFRARPFRRFNGSRFDAQHPLGRKNRRLPTYQPSA